MTKRDREGSYVHDHNHKITATCFLYAADVQAIIYNFYFKKNFIGRGVTRGRD